MKCPNCQKYRVSEVKVGRKIVFQCDDCGAKWYTENKTK